MTLPSLLAPLITANPGINLITRLSPRGWGMEAPHGIPVAQGCWGGLGSQALPAAPSPPPRLEGPPGSPPQGTCSDPPGDQMSGSLALGSMHRLVWGAEDRDSGEGSRGAGEVCPGL